jgi:nucleoside-diphosphate-sugar epimerase
LKSGHPYEVDKMKNIMVTGGAGYVGSSLIPRLLSAGHKVNVLDLFLYGDDVFGEFTSHENLNIFKGDIRDINIVKESLVGVDTVIHLACISNDPSFELNPSLGKEINLDAFRPLVESSISAGVQRFIYASSSSVYGIKKESNVTEDMLLEPLTDYSRFKADCEKILSEYQSEEFTTVTIRPATVCGYAKRQRLDVIVNILTNHAFNNRKIKVFGGDQLRPNIHIDDMVRVYELLLDIEKSKIAGKVFNAGYDNFKVNEIAKVVQEVIGSDVAIETVPTDDNRSYHIASSKIEKELGFKAQKSIRDAVADLKNAFEKGLLPDSMDGKRYFNIKTMLEQNLK